jgi:hypothetical protein
MLAEPDVNAAGDVANTYNHSPNEWRRVEHRDCANSMSGQAGIATARIT